MLWFFFFKQKMAYEIVDCDWSSDVCSSDLLSHVAPYFAAGRGVFMDVISTLYEDQKADAEKRANR